MRPIRFCFPTLRQRAPVSMLHPAHRSRFFTARALDGVPPIETGDRALHDAPIASAGHHGCRGAFWAFSRDFSRAATPCDRASDASVATPADTGARLFAVRACRFLRGPPRPLPPRRRDATWLSPVRDAFHRRGARCSFSALSSGDCVPFAPLIAGPELPRAGSRGAIAPRAPVIGSSSPSAPFATCSFAARGFERSARHQGRDVSTRLSSEGLAPVHRVPHRSFERLRLGEGLLWAEPLVDFC